MKNKAFKKLLRMVHNMNVADYKKQARISFGLSTTQLEKENPEMYVAISSDDESRGSSYHRRSIYNVRDIQMDESDYLGDSTVDSDSQSYHESYDWTDDILNTVDRPVLTEIYAVENEGIGKFLNEDVLFLPTEPSAVLPIVPLSFWFPIFVDGVCRFLGKMKSERSKRLYQTVTEAVFQYNDDDRMVITNSHRYKLIGEMNTSYLDNGGSDLGELPRLTNSSWLQDVVVLSSKAVFGNRFLTTTSLYGLKHEQVLKFKISQLSKTSMNKILKRHKPETVVTETAEIRAELAVILRLCQNKGDWQVQFREFLRKYGQRADVSEHVIADCHDVRKTSFGNIDLNNSEDCDDFGLYGKMVNSTINNNMENLYLWTITRKNGHCCISGIKRDGRKYNEVIPSVIKTVTSDGTCVLTENDQFNLVGPMLKLSIYCCYPQTLNSHYLDLFQEHFMHGLPKYWKALAAIMYIICSECKKLRRSTVSSDSARQPSLRIKKRTAIVTPSSGTINNTHTSTELRAHRPPFCEHDLDRARGSPSFSWNEKSDHKSVPTLSGDAIENEGPVSFKSSRDPSAGQVTVVGIQSSRRSLLFCPETDVVGRKHEQSALSIFHDDRKKSVKVALDPISETPSGTSRKSNIRLTTRKPGRPRKRKVTESPTASRATKRIKTVISVDNDEDTHWTKSTGKATNKSGSSQIHDTIIDATISVETHRRSVQVRSHKSLKIQGRVTQDNVDLIYNPISGFPINLSKLPITRSGRLSLPPPDILSRTKFERVGDEVHFISRSTTKMVFTRGQ